MLSYLLVYIFKAFFRFLFKKKKKKSNGYTTCKDHVCMYVCIPVRRVVS